VAGAQRVERLVAVEQSGKNQNQLTDADFEWATWEDF
jgi:hypothetical protein